LAASYPVEGAHHTPPEPWLEFRGLTSKRRIGKGKGK